MRNRRLIRFGFAGVARVVHPVPMHDGMINPGGHSPIAKTLNWLQGALFGGHAEGVKP